MFSSTTLEWWAGLNLTRTLWPASIWPLSSSIVVSNSSPLSGWTLIVAVRPSCPTARMVAVPGLPSLARRSFSISSLSRAGIVRRPGLAGPVPLPAPAFPPSVPLPDIASASDSPALSRRLPAWIHNAYIRAIPAELEEAALVDGASRLGALRRVTLPLAMPGLVTALIFTFIAAWNEFVVALTLTTGSAVMPLTVRLDSFIGQYTVDWQHLFGASVVTTIPVIILFALIERRVVGGLTAGSVK